MKEFVFILDRSGSMAGLESDTIGGFNSMIENQDERKEVLVSTVLFDNKMEILHDRVLLEDIDKLTKKDYYVRGTTALLDALGYSINHIENVHRYIRKEDIPEKTVFIITTDGYENSSMRFSYRDIRNLLSKKKEDGWEFLFLGSNIDVEEEGRNLGIEKNRVMSYESDEEGIEESFSAMEKVMESISKGKPIPGDWNKRK